MLSLLLKVGCDVSLLAVNDDTPLHYAAGNENPAVAAALIAAGAAVNARNMSGQTPCHYAASNPNLAVITLLLAHGVDVNAVDAALLKPCDIACANRNGDVLVALLSHGGEFGTSDVALFNAVENPLAIQCLLDRNVNISGYHVDGVTVLHEAARRGSVQVVQRLLAAGADIHKRCARYERTVLHFACMNKDVGPLRVLVAAGANLRGVDKFSSTALHTACALDNIAAVTFLASVGLDVVEAAKVDASLVCRAASARTVAVPQHLIRNGVDFRARNKECETPCYRASAGGLEKLFAVGANLNVSHSCGTAELQSAPASLFVRPVLTLVAAGADAISDLQADLALLHDLSADSLTVLVVAGDLDPIHVTGRVIWDKPDILESTIDRIAQRQFELLRLRGFEIVVGLQPLGLSALVTCEILSFAFAPRTSLVPFHRLWAMATIAKHFKTI